MGTDDIEENIIKGLGNKNLFFCESLLSKDSFFGFLILSLAIFFTLRSWKVCLFKSSKKLVGASNFRFLNGSLYP